MADSFNFFSDRPIDYGSEYIYRGRAELGAGIAKGLGGIAANNQSAKDYKMKMDLEHQMKIDDEDRTQLTSLMNRWADAHGNTPPPMGANGKPDKIAMMGNLGNFDRVGKPLQVEAGAMGVTRPTITTPGQQPGEDALDGDTSPMTDSTSRPGTDAEFAQAINKKKSDNAFALKSQELAGALSARTASQADANRQDISVMLSQRPELASYLPKNWQSMSDAQINGSYPAIKGALANADKNQIANTNAAALRAAEGTQQAGGTSLPQIKSFSDPIPFSDSGPEQDAAAAPKNAADKRALYIQNGGTDQHWLADNDKAQAGEEKAAAGVKAMQNAKDTALQTAKGLIFNANRANKILSAHPGFMGANMVAGPMGGMLEDHGLGGSDANDLRGALDSMAGANMMTSIGALKAGSTTGSTGLGRILLPEATAMSNLQGLLKSDDKGHGAQRQSAGALTTAVTQTKQHALTTAAHLMDLDPNKFTTHDKQAFEWAMDNTDDPKAKVILSTLGYKGN